VSNPAIVVPFVLVMVGVVVGIDLLFFRDRTWFWERLAANVGVVLASTRSTSDFGDGELRHTQRLLGGRAPCSRGRPRPRRGCGFIGSC
jgi:hypothetical protein